MVRLKVLELTDLPVEGNTQASIVWRTRDAGGTINAPLTMKPPKRWFRSCSRNWKKL